MGMITLLMVQRHMNMATLWDMTKATVTDTTMGTRMMKPHMTPPLDITTTTDTLIDHRVTGPAGLSWRPGGSTQHA